MKIINFGKACKAATAIEYGLIIALIAMAIIGSMRALGGEVGEIWEMISNRVTDATTFE